MLIAYAAVAAIYAVLLGLSARLKLTHDERAVEVIGKIVGVPLSWFPWLAIAEIAGGLGLLIGIGVKPLGLAAAGALTVYFVVATAGHIRVRDFANIQSALLMLAIAIAALVLRLVA
jgi:uncharacterized membrane protein YphA (DoxX/SURF4 family)